MTTQSITKTCSHCHLELTLDKFERRNNGGLRSQCRDCRVQIAKEHYHRDHPVTAPKIPAGKRIVAPVACGNCGKRIRRPSVRGGFLCIDCRPGGRAMPKPSASASTSSICDFCPWFKPCRERVLLGGWAICELPDENDLRRIELLGHKYEDGRLTMRPDVIEAVRQEIKETQRENAYLQFDYEDFQEWKEKAGYSEE